MYLNFDTRHLLKMKVHLRALELDYFGEKINVRNLDCSSNVKSPNYITYNIKLHITSAVKSFCNK